MKVFTFALRQFFPQSKKGSKEKGVTHLHDMEKQTVGVCFWAKKIGGTLRPGSDASDVRFFLLDAIPEEMAFPTDLLVCEQLRSCLKSGYLSSWLNSCVARKWTTLDM